MRRKPRAKAPNEAAKAVAAMGIEPADLELLTYTVVRWVCGCAGCDGYTRVREYGIFPYYYSARADGSERCGWVDVTRNYWLCSKHHKQYKTPHYPPPPVRERFNDPRFGEIVIQPLLTKKRRKL